MFYSSFEHQKVDGETNIRPRVNAFEETLDGGKLNLFISNGPDENWCGSKDRGFCGGYCLEVRGKHENCGRSTAHAVVFEDVNEVIGENTVFSYCLFPDFKGEYDYERAAHYICVDLKFTDGTYLTEAGLCDTAGHPFTVSGKALSRAVYTKQWNQIEVDISSLAGKTVEKILVRYDKPKKSQHIGTLEYFAYIDGIKIADKIDSYQEKSDYVLTTRGTNDELVFSRGLCIPSTCVPHPFNFYCPSTSGGGRSIYDFDAKKITHFIVSHQASYHLCDYGCFMFMPNTSVSSPDAENCKAANRAAEFSHTNEVAKAHIYSVNFAEKSAAAGVSASLAPESHSLLASFDFPQDSENVNVIFDCVCEYTNYDSSITFGEDGTFTAESLYKFGPQGKQFDRMYYYGVFSEVPEKTENLADDHALAIACFKKGTKNVTLRLASSYISVEQAKKNLELEISADDTIQSISDRAKAQWDKYLNLFDIKGATEEQSISFYSNIYRMFMYPFTLSENIGTAEDPHYAYLSPYSVKDGKKEIKDGIMYTSNGFWDTYRTTWAAYSLLCPSHDSELLNNILTHYHDCGWVGRWLYPGAINCMVGTSSDVIFADAASKGIEFDFDAGYKSALKNATVYSPDTTYGRCTPHLSIFHGYTPDSVSWSLENNVTDYGLSVLAEIAGDKDEYEYFRNCSLRYKNIFSKQADFFVGRTAEGDFVTDVEHFDPYKWGDGYCETNGWGMAFTVQHDILGMRDLYGGKKAFTDKVDGMFNAETRYSASWCQHEMYEAREIQLGQYQHSNQPAHHNIFMYNYTDTPYKTQRYSRDVLDRLYISNKFGQGYMGDDDNGEQSAWYILAAMGFYPMNMGSRQYMITSPLFEEITLHRETGDIVIKANNNSRENVYIKSMTIDGKPYNNVFITHDDLISAKEIVFEMSSVPSDFGVNGETPASVTPEGENLRPYDDITKGLSCSDFIGVDCDAKDALFDDNMLTDYTFEQNELNITVKNTSQYPVRIATVSSADDISKMPCYVAVYGGDSADGEFTLLAERNGISWQWEHQLKPVSFENDKVYNFYRIELKGENGLKLSEIELLA